MTKTKFVHLDELYNFAVDDFSFGIICCPNFFKNYSYSDIQISNYSNELGWRNDQNQSCRSWWGLQLLFSWLFQFKSFGVSKCCLNLSFLEIQILNCSNKVTWKDDQNKCYKSCWVVQLLYSWLFYSKSYDLSICCFKFPYFWISKFYFFKQSNSKFAWQHIGVTHM
jgi:hypothetical protein